MRIIHTAGWAYLVVLVALSGLFLFGVSPALAVEDVEAPIARLTVNGSASATVFEGDRPRYEWSSENADTFVSRFSTTDSSCTADGSTVGDWIALSASGASDTNAIADYQRDCTYTITYRASRLEGDIQLFDSSTITVTVEKGDRKFWDRMVGRWGYTSFKDYIDALISENFTRSEVDTADSDILDNIHPDGLRLSLPRQDARLVRNRDATFVWRVTEVPGARVSIVLTSENGNDYRIAHDELDDGSFVWRVVGTTISGGIQVPNGVYVPSVCYKNVCRSGNRISIGDSVQSFEGNTAQPEVSISVEIGGKGYTGFARIPKNGRALITWSGSNVTACSLSALQNGTQTLNWDRGTSVRPTTITGQKYTDRISSFGTYAIACENQTSKSRATATLAITADSIEVLSTEAEQAICSLTANPARVEPGQPVSLISNATGLKTFTLTDSDGRTIGEYSANGTLRIFPKTSTVYTARYAESSGKDIECRASVTVERPGPDHDDTVGTPDFFVDLKIDPEDPSDGPYSVRYKEQPTLLWNSRGVTACSALVSNLNVPGNSGWRDTLPVNGQTNIGPMLTPLTYIISCRNDEGRRVTDSLQVLVHARSSVDLKPLRVQTRQFLSGVTHFVPEGATFELQYEARDVYSCERSVSDQSAGGSDWAKGISTAGTRTVGPLSSTQTFTITCRDVLGNIVATDSETININTASYPTDHSTVNVNFSASPTSGSAPLAVSFGARSESNIPDSRYYIDFGDGSEGDMHGISGICQVGAGGPCNPGGENMVASHIYSEAGTYTASLNRRYICNVPAGLGCPALYSEGVASVNIEVTPPATEARVIHFSANNREILTVNPGDQITYRWSAEGGASYGSRWSSIGPSTCAGEGEWVARSASGTDTATVGSHQAGCTYTIGYFVYGNADRTNGVAFDDVTVVVGGLMDSAPVTPTPEPEPITPTPTPEPTPFINITSCANSSSGGCAGSNRVIFPVRNGAGAFNRYPVYCAGSYSINTAGTSWSSSCSTGFQTLTNCQTPDGRSISFCPASPPTSKSSVSCVNKVCTGYNSRVFPVENGNGQKNTDPYACDGSWQINTSGSNFTSSCADSKGWYRVASSENSRNVAGARSVGEWVIEGLIRLLGL